ncbi:MAG: hypothetical protein [Microvirus sp.]|nr:MAG: hypothetical protein [Microvirus sp.]
MAKKSVIGFVRTLWDMGDYNDDEKNTEPSMTDPSQDEPIEKLVARLVRGEMVNTSSVHYDTDGLAPGADPSLNAVNTSGFDLSDVPPLLDAAEQAAAALRAAPPPSAGVSPQPEVKSQGEPPSEAPKPN